MREGCARKKIPRHFCRFDYAYPTVGRCSSNFSFPRKETKDDLPIVDPPRTTTLAPSLDRLECNEGGSSGDDCEDDREDDELELETGEEGPSSLSVICYRKMDELVQSDMYWRRERGERGRFLPALLANWSILCLFSLYTLFQTSPILCCFQKNPIERISNSWEVNNQQSKTLISVCSLGTSNLLQYRSLQSMLVSERRRNVEDTQAKHINSFSVK